jgi:hypothetical protein
MPEVPFKIPGVWTEDKPPPSPRMALNIPSVVIELKLEDILVSQRPYYIPHKAQIGIQKHLDRLLK